MDDIEIKRNELAEIATKHALRYHVSLAEPRTNLPFPEGSATLAKFSIIINNISIDVYGILTAAHVIYAIFPEFRSGFIKHPWIGLSKPSVYGEIGCLHHFRFLMCTLDDPGDLDLGFFLLGTIKKPPTHPLFLCSDFYDLDIPQQLTYQDSSDGSGLFRGAQPVEDPDETFLDSTGFYCGGGEVILERQKLKYWKSKKLKNFSMAGASGAAFWRFRLADIQHIQQNSLKAAFGGVVLEQDKNNIFALSYEQLFEQFLPDLKKEICKHWNWSWSMYY
jgi:hypothetical protein